MEIETLVFLWGLGACLTAATVSVVFNLEKDNEVSLMVFISIFWFVCVPIMIGFWIAKSVGEFADFLRRNK